MTATVCTIIKSDRKDRQLTSGGNRKLNRWDYNTLPHSGHIDLHTCTAYERSERGEGEEGERGRGGGLSFPPILNHDINQVILGPEDIVL